VHHTLFYINRNNWRYSGHFFWYCKWRCTYIYFPLNLSLEFPHGLQRKSCCLHLC
jgi:hypothetical protein